MAIEINENSQELVKGFGEFKEMDANYINGVKVNTNAVGLLHLAKSRRSIRNFENKDVTKKQLIKLIEAAQAAPSAGNCQPWHFYVLKNKEIQEKINESAYYQGWIVTAPACIIVCTDCKRNAERYGERGRDLYAIQDTAAAIQNILLCAKDMGLGTCWIGAFDESKVSEILKLPEGFRPVAIIPVGYPAEDFKPQNRRAIDEIVTFIE